MWKTIKSNNQKGLTLIELVATILIIGIIAAIAIPAVNNVVNNSKEKSNLANQNMIYEAANRYLTDYELNKGPLTGTITVLIKEELVGTTSATGGYLAEVPKNPENGRFYRALALTKQANGSWKVETTTAPAAITDGSRLAATATTLTGGTWTLPYYYMTTN